MSIDARRDGVGGFSRPRRSIPSLSLDQRVAEREKNQYCVPGIRMGLPVCYDDVLVEIDPNMFRVPMVLDELAESKEKAPRVICVMLGLEPGATFREVVERYRSGIAPPTPQPSPTRGRGPLVMRKRKKKPRRPRLIEASV